MRLLIVAALVCPAALAQPDHDVVVNLAGVELKWVFPSGWPTQTRDSNAHPFPPGTPQTILPAFGYAYDIKGVVTTTGLFGSIVPSGSTLQQALDFIEPGNGRILRGFVRHHDGSLSAPKSTVLFQHFAGTLSGLDLGITLESWINPSGFGVFQLRDIDIPFGPLAGTMKVDSGTAEIRTWVPSPRQETEWHFSGSLAPVQGSAGSSLRYLDDPAFGTILGGIGNENTPDPSIPHGVTAMQSSFTTTQALGIPGPGGLDDLVYAASPARNLATGNPDHSRGLGLALYPRLQPEFPGEHFGQWTFIIDLFIPPQSWFVDFPANTQPREFPVAILQDSHNNEGNADVFIRNAPGVGPTIGYADGTFTNYIPIPITHSAWHRLALVVNHTQKNQTRIFLNGSLVGTTHADWLYDAVNPADPRFGDGEPVTPGDWSSWGEFPSPWARSSGTHPGSLGPTPLASTLCLFADLGDAVVGAGGRSEVVYLANLYFADDLLSDAEIATLGGPNAKGIRLFGCKPDCEGDGDLDIFDFLCFQGKFAALDPYADFEGDGDWDVFDFLAFQGSFANGCP